MKDSSISKDSLFRNRSARIELQHLQYAVAAADYGSLRQAAEALLVRQSTLSRCVRQLEQAIGVTVFDRSSNGVRTTHAGRHLFRTARSILEQMDTLVTHTHSTGRGEAGRLTVGFYTSQPGITSGYDRHLAVDPDIHDFSYFAQIIRGDPQEVRRRG